MGTYYGQNNPMGGGPQTAALTSYDDTASGIGANVQLALNSVQSNKAPKLDGNPNGFTDRTEAVLSWSDATRTLTISPAGADFSFYSDGNPFTKTAPESKQIDDIELPWFIYYDSAGILQAAQAVTSDIVLRHAFVAFIYWDATNKQAVPSVLCEMHGAEMPAEVHAYLHNAFGTRYISGLNLTVLSDQTGDLAAHAQFAGASGVIYDEDITHSVQDHISTADEVRVMYREGAAGYWRMSAALSFLVDVAGTGRAAWNSPDAGGPGVWGLTEISNNDFVLAHVFAVPGLNHNEAHYVVIMGQADYLTKTAARAGAVVEAALLDLDYLPVSEGLLVATVIMQTSDGYANAVKSKIVTTDEGADFIDWRHSPLSPVG